VLYSEKIATGFTVVVPNHDKGDYHIDLELLFNTVDAQGSNIDAYFLPEG